MMLSRRIYKLAEEVEEVKDQEEQEVVECTECSNHLTPDQIGNSDYYDRNNNPYCSEHVAECDNCPEVHPKVDMKLGMSSREYYCEECFNDLFVVCPNCETTVEQDDFFPPNIRNQRRYGGMTGGGCTNCAVKCYSCDKVLDKEDDDLNVAPDGGESYCGDCFWEHYTTCIECSDIMDIDSGTYVSDDGSYCDYCFGEKFYICYECNEPVEKDEAVESDDEFYHSDCAPEGASKIKNLEVEVSPEALPGFSYTKKDRLLMPLMKMLPISVKDLKQRNPSLAAGLSDLINFVKGKDLTLELVEEFRASLQPEEFPVEYSTWSGMQRSVRKKSPQLVLKILASPQILSKLNEKKGLIDLFNAINQLSQKSGHPSSPNQLGWARIEISPDKEYMLVDEIQMDHMNAAFKIKNESQYLKPVRDRIKENNNLTDEELDALLTEFLNILKDFPNIASNAVERLAKANGIKKIFWHTYESGMRLKGNRPPKSLYTSTPKENLYLPSAEKPFGLEGEFLEKEAKKAYLRYKLAQLWTKRFN